MNVLASINLQPTREQEELRGSVRRVVKKITRTMDQINYRKVDHNVFRQIQTFFPNGNLKEEVHYNPDGTESLRERYIYNDESHLTEKLSCNPAGDPRMKWLFHFQSSDEKNLNCIVEEMRNEDDVFQGKDLFYVDEKGRKIKEFSYDESNERVLESRFDYESQDHQTKMTWTTWNPQGELMTKRIYFYDNNGYLQEKQQLTMRDELESKEIYRYNDEGFLVEFCVYQDEIESYKYRYYYKVDSQSNWIERKTGILYPNQSRQEELISEIETREIEYYQ